MRIIKEKEKKIKMKYNRIELESEHLPYKNNTICLKFEKNHNIIFARNGSGKSTIARMIYDYKENEVNNENEKVKFLCKSKNSNGDNKSAIVELKNIEDVKVFNYDYKLELDEDKIKGATSVIVTNEAIADLNFRLVTLENKIWILAKELARFGGSIKNPDGTMARKLYVFGVKGASFNGNLKERFFPSPLGYLKEVVESEIYNKILECYDLEFDYNLFLNKYGAEHDVKQLEIIKKFSSFKNFDKLKELVREFETEKKSLMDEEKKEIEATRTIAEPYLKTMNINLKTIFFSSNRLKFIPQEDQLYQVISRGKIVNKLENLSTAEKNIIKLVHFFSRINEDFPAEKYNNVLIVIDDPISSTDFENKIGIYSYLRKQLEFLDKKRIKTLFLTHDEDVLQHIQKVYEDINNDFQSFELRPQIGLNPIDKYTNFYSERLLDVFLFASGYRKELQPYIGNIMRRVLEGYSKFNYLLGLEKLTRDYDLRSRFIEKYIDEDIINNLMYRLVLNSESHAEGQLQLERDYESYFTYEELKKTAQAIITILYKLDNVHVQKHIKQFIPRFRYAEKFLKEKHIKIKQIEDKKSALKNISDLNKQNGIKKEIQDILIKLEELNNEDIEIYQILQDLDTHIKNNVLL